MRLMSGARICFFATVVLVVNGCNRGAEKPAPASESVPQSITPASTAVTEPAVTEPATQAATEPIRPSKSPVETGLPPSPKEKSNPPAAPRTTTQSNSPTVQTKPSVAQAKPPAPTPSASVPPAPKPATAPDSPVTLDMLALEKQLKSTKAIGLFSKIALKNQVDDLMKNFRQHYKGKTPPTMTDLRSSYDLLMMKVLSMVQDDDQKLASAIVASRAAIWDLLSDPKKFAALDA